MAEHSGFFTRDAARRIATQTRRMEAIPWADGIEPSHDADPPLAHLFRRFELKDDLADGNPATAYLLYWDSDADDWAIDTDVEFEVVDMFGSRRGQARISDLQKGTRGTCIKFHDSAVWEIVTMEHQARWIEFMVNDASGFTTSDSSVTVDGVIYHDGYEPNTAITIVYNGSSAAGCRIFYGDDNDVGEAIYDPAADKYIINQVECP